MLGKKRKYCKKKGLRVLNEEIANAIKDKKSAHLQFLQWQTDEAREIYRRKRNEVKIIVRKVHQEFWDIFISTVDHDVHGRQMMAYKVLKHLDSEERDVANLNIIREEQWI